MSRAFESVRALAFDHYGTLFDKQGLADAADAHFPGRGAELAKLWFATIQRYCWLNGLMGRYETWDDMTRGALTFAARSLDLPIDDRAHAALVEADLGIRPYPEVDAALERLAARFPLYVLSMASRSMLEATQRNAGTARHFAGIVSCEAARVYKPAAAAYALGVEAIGLPKERIGFVSSNPFDVAGSAAFGFPTCWVDRAGEPLDELGLAPDLVVADLASLADRLGA